MIKLHSIKNRTGFTLVEMAISVAIVSIALVFLAYLTVLEGRRWAQVYHISRAESKVYYTCELLRYHLITGKRGSVEIKNGGDRIEFLDPYVGSNKCAFDFSNNKLTYDDNINAGPSAIRRLKGLSDVSFSVLNNGAKVLATVKADATVGGTTTSSQQTIEVFLRH